MIMTKADLSGNVYEWNPWTGVAPHDPDQDKPVGKPTTEKVDGATRTVQRRKITRTPDTIVTFNPNTDMLYPGAILRSDTAVEKGFLVSAGIEAADRAPLTVTIDVLSAGGSKTVEHPDYGKVIDAIKNAVKGNKSQSPSYIFEKIAAHDSTQVALELGISAKYLGASGSLDIKADYTSQTSTVMGYLRLKAFTATCTLNTPDDLVNDNFTEDKLGRLVDDGLMGESNPPLIVSDVYYGQLLMFTMTAKESSTQLKAALDASYRGFVDVDASVKAEYQRIIGETEIKVLSQGGDPGRVQTLLDGGKLSDYFKADEPMEEYIPIGYALKTLDGYPAKMSETADYDDVAWKVAHDWQGAIDAVMFLHDHYWLFKGDECVRTNPQGTEKRGPYKITDDDAWPGLAGTEFESGVNGVLNTTVEDHQGYWFFRGNRCMKLAMDGKTVDQGAGTITRSWPVLKDLPRN
jgi:hypothetical protein